MIRKLLLGVLPIAMIALFTSEKMSDNGKAGYTGSPGEQTCTNCHSDFALNSGGGSIAIGSPSMTNWEYLPNTTYNMSVTVSRSANSLFGIAIEALDATNDNAGTLNITDAASTQIKTRTVSGVVRRNVVHQLNGGATAAAKEFNFSWTSPATNIGPVTFYFAGAAADADGAETGDYVYSGSQVANPNTTATNDLNVDAVQSVYPNPASSFITVTYKANLSGLVTMNLFSLKGDLVQKHISSTELPGTHTEVIRNLSALPTGVYFLQTIVDGSAKIQKVIIQ